MKKVIILCAFMVAFAASSFAQADAQPAPMAEKTEKTKGRGGKKGGKDNNQAAMSMKKQLNLTSEQEMKMKDIADNNKGKLKAIKSDNTLDKTQKREKMLAIQNEFDSDMRGVLNAEQYTKFTELKKQHRGNKRDKKGSKGPQ